MEKDHLRINEHGNFVNNPNGRDRTGIDGSLLMRGRSETTPSDFVLQWGNRKRLRCMKVQVKGKDVSSRPVHRTTVRVDRRVVRAEKESLNQNHQTGINNPNHHSNGYFNLRQRTISPQPPPPPPPAPLHRILRNSEISSAMKGNGVRAAIASPERGGAHDKRSLSTYNNININYHNSDNHQHHHHHHKSADAAHDSKKGGSSSGSGDAAAIPVWPPKFVIGLTNKEKEEDFMAIKGSKLPQRPKKRAKIIQRTINLVCPGTWLCDLTLERYEVREKKIAKKRPRGLKAIVNMESDSE